MDFIYTYIGNLHSKFGFFPHIVNKYLINNTEHFWQVYKMMVKKNLASKLGTYILSCLLKRIVC